MTAKIIDGRKIAKQIRKKVSEKREVLELKYNVKPNITTINIGSDPASELYMKLRDNACKEVGINSSHLEFSENISEQEILKEIKTLNKDNTVHGILIQYPVPEHITPDKLMNAVTPSKDVEGFNPYNMGQTLIGDEHLIPCTPLSVLTILEHEKTNLRGKHAVIVNHSNIVGKPLTGLFLNRNATVSVCHVFTDDIKKYTTRADILVTAAGIPKLITKNHVKKDAFVIDVGIVKTKDGICGDVDFNLVSEIAGKITPVPGGVGPVTVASSLINMLITYENTIQE